MKGKIGNERRRLTFNVVDDSSNYVVVYCTQVAWKKGSPSQCITLTIYICISGTYLYVIGISSHRYDTFYRGSLREYTG